MTKKKTASGAKRVYDYLLTFKDRTSFTHDHVARRMPDLSGGSISGILSKLSSYGALVRNKGKHGYRVDALKLVEYGEGKTWHGEYKTRTFPSDREVAKAMPKRSTDADVLLALVEAIHAAAPVLNKYHELAVAFEKLNE